MKEKAFRQIPGTKGIGNEAGLSSRYTSALHMWQCSLDLERCQSTRHLSAMYGVIA